MSKRRTKQLGSHVIIATNLPRGEALDVMRLAEKKGTTVSRLLRTICMPLIKEELARLDERGAA